MNRAIRFAAAAAACFIAACNDAASTPTGPAATTALLAKGGGGGGGGGGGSGTPAPATRCATITVTNNPQSVRRSVMPDIRYNLENCGGASLSVTVSVVETDGFLSVLCPSPVAEPVTYALGANDKISATAPVFRGPCGTTGPVNGTLVQGVNRWQGHNLLLTLTDNETGVVYGTSPFNWQDIFAPGI